MPNVDTIIAVSEVANAFHAQFVPCFTNTYLAVTPQGDQGNLTQQLNIILYSNFISLFCITFLVFVPWKKGPEQYLKISPKIFMCLIYLNYVILPVANIGLSIFYTINPKYDLKKIP